MTLERGPTSRKNRQDSRTGNSHEQNSDRDLVQLLEQNSTRQLSGLLQQHPPLMIEPGPGSRNTDGRELSGFRGGCCVCDGSGYYLRRDWYLATHTSSDGRGMIGQGSGDRRRDRDEGNVDGSAHSSASYMYAKSYIRSLKITWEGLHFERYNMTGNSR